MEVKTGTVMKCAYSKLIFGTVENTLSQGDCDLWELIVYIMLEDIVGSEGDISRTCYTFQCFSINTCYISVSKQGGISCLCVWEWRDPVT